MTPQDVLQRLEKIPVGDSYTMTYSDAWRDYGPRLVAVARAAQKLDAALAAVKPALDSGAVFMHIHGQRYEGPTFGNEWEALRIALAALGEEAE